MRRFTRITLFYLVAALALTVPVASGDKDAKQHKNKFQTVEVVRFDVQQGVEFPLDYLITLTEELVDQLKQTGKFKEVLREGETPTLAAVAGLRLVGTVTEFQKGSRAKRYLIGFGAGKTKVVAHVRWIDRQTNEVVFEDDVDGKVIMGFTGGESIGATRGLAKEVAKVTKKTFF